MGHGLLSEPKGSWRDQIGTALSRHAGVVSVTRDVAADAQYLRCLGMRDANT